MFFFWMRNFRKKAHKLKSRLNTTTVFFFGNQMKYQFYVVNSVENFCTVKSFSCFVVILNETFPKSQGFPKISRTLQKKNVSPLFCWVYIGKFLHSLKISANGIRAICHFLQVWFSEHNILVYQLPLVTTLFGVFWDEVNGS